MAQEARRTLVCASFRRPWSECSRTSSGTQYSGVPQSFTEGVSHIAVCKALSAAWIACLSIIGFDTHPPAADGRAASEQQPLRQRHLDTEASFQVSSRGTTAPRMQGVLSTACTKEIAHPIVLLTTHVPSLRPLATRSLHPPTAQLLDPVTTLSTVHRSPTTVPTPNPTFPTTESLPRTSDILDAFFFESPPATQPRCGIFTPYYDGGISVYFCRPS